MQKRVLIVFFLNRTLPGLRIAGSLRCVNRISETTGIRNFNLIVRRFIYQPNFAIVVINDNFS